MKNLFRSSASFELLDLLARQPETSFRLVDLAKALNKNPANLMRELDRLKQEGLILQRLENGNKSYAFETRHPWSREIRGLFLKMQTDQRVSNAKANHDRFATNWLLAEDIPNICPFFSKIWLNCFVKEFARPGGRAYKKIAAVYRDYHLWFYYDAQDAEEVGQHIVDRFEKDVGFMEKTNQRIVEFSDKLRALVNRIPDAGLQKLSAPALWKIYTAQEKLHTEYYQWGWLPVAADMFGDQLTNGGKKILRGLGVKETAINESLVLLTQPTQASLIKQEQEELIDIGIRVQAQPAQLKLFKEIFRKFKEEDVKLFKLYEHSPQYEQQFETAVRALVGRIDRSIIKALNQHFAKYFYTRFLFTEEQGVYTFEYFLKSLVRTVNGNSDLAGTRLREQKECTDLLRKRAALMSKLRLSKDQRRFFDAWGNFMLTKIYRRYAQIFAIYKMTPVLEEIGRRLGLTIKEIKFMTTEEIERALLGGQPIKLTEIRARIKFSVYYADAHERRFLSETEAREAVKLIEKQDLAMVNELHGQCGCPGFARGPVKIVNLVEDMNKCKAGDVLVSISTQPDLVPAMKRAAAFVTEQGGVTSHAAIVAREMNKPCVIGTRIATKILKDGMTVEVDATKGVVKIIQP